MSPSRKLKQLLDLRSEGQVKKTQRRTLKSKRRNALSAEELQQASGVGVSGASPQSPSGSGAKPMRPLSAKGTLGVLPLEDSRQRAPARRC